MAKLGRKRSETRPEGYDSAVAKVLSNEMSFKEAAKDCGCTYAWFCKLFKRDYPDFKPKTDWQKKITREIGKANKKYTSWLAANIEDADLCEFIRSKGKCSECPRNCVSHRRTKGLGNVISETRVLLKDSEKPSEESNAQD